jgi:hypothetical protein
VHLERSHRCYLGTAPRECKPKPERGRWRSHSLTAGLPVAIYTIAYSGNGGTDRGLLKRLANTQDSTSYDPTQQSGIYVEVHSADQLNAAFSMVASELLRLAK